MSETIDDIITRMWPAHTSPEIAAVVGWLPSRVRVRARKLGLPFKTTGRPRRVTPPEQQVEAPKPVRLPRVWRNPPIVRFKTCQWMLGKHCHKPTQNGEPWCPEHKARVFARGERANV